ncbi:MAG: HWE histidine kinase domain-containing protein [Geminicoccaceae bacterium]
MASKRAPPRSDPRRLLTRELEHRLGNTLARVQALARQSFPRRLVPRDLREAFEGRLMALAAAHRVLARGQWQKASLRELVAALTATSGGGRPALAGPAVALRPEAATALALALHELAADAARRGAAPVAVVWRTRPGGGVELDWEEQGGAPPAGEPAPMLARLVRHELQGGLTSHARPPGPVLRLTVGAAGIHHGD